LSIAEKQGRVQLDSPGVAVALAIKNKMSKPFEKVNWSFWWVSRTGWWCCNYLEIG
jgi:hypothetical protein